MKIHTIKYKPSLSLKVQPLVLLFIVILYSCTSGPQANVSSDQNVKLNKYKTFAWLPQDKDQCRRVENTLYSELMNNPITERNIKDMVNTNLIKKGYSIRIDTPDFLIQYKIIVKESEQIVSTPVITSQTNSLNGASTNAPFILDASVQPTQSNFDRVTGNTTGYPYSYTYSGMGNVIPGTSGPAYMPGNSVVNTYIVGSQITKHDFNEGTLILDIVDRRTNELVWRGWSRETLGSPEDFERNLSAQITDIVARMP